MRLAIDSFENLIELENSWITEISVQSVHYFAKLLRSFYNCSTGVDSEIVICLVDDNEKRIDLSGKFEMIMDPLMIDFASKKIMSALTDKLKIELINDIESYTEIENMCISLQEKVVDMLDDFNLPLLINNHWDAARIIKTLSISVDCDKTLMSQLDLLIKFLQIVGELNISSYFCFVNLNRILTEDELESFYKEALRQQIQVICLNQRDDAPEPNPYVSFTFIDSEFEEHYLAPKI